MGGGGFAVVGDGLRLFAVVDQRWEPELIGRKKTQKAQK
jgi:hypothetical protein